MTRILDVLWRDGQKKKTYSHPPLPKKREKKVCIYSCCVHLCQVGLSVKWGQ